MSADEDRVTLDAALASVYLHDDETGHGTRFHSSNACVEYVCVMCGEVLYEGPPFDDPEEGFLTWSAPRYATKSRRNH